MIDLHIPDHEIDMGEVIGQGCTAVVHVGTWTRNGNAVRVAIKKMSEALQSPGQQQAVVRECGVLSKVRHPNLVQFYGTMVNLPFRIVTEYCEGGVAFELLHNMQEEVDLSHRQKTKMILDVALAMNYLHAFDPMIIHRDLKSLNLLMSRQLRDKDYGTVEDIPHAKVCDFGVARLMQQGEWGEMTSQAGTKHWMAPEMWQHNNYDEKVDVYSFAMVTYEIICREVPFEEEEPADVGKYTLAGVRPDMDAIPPDTVKGIVVIMESCWKQDPAARPSFATVLERLEPIYLQMQPDYVRP
eukprot:TRINITY_DN19867_c0_g3_i1.p1 TRINITY_DN19867_c0_g3~~TRINITY_DN19867_c0_g3_i1.p1  ORF type:complete len:298 (+),score=52.15 TRINITY_DN19867_c0_g3_i1:205-1098(+)